MMKLVACVAIVCSLIIGACADYSARSLAGSFGITGTTDGQGSAARFNKPTSVFLQNSLIYVADTGSSTIRQVAETSANTLTWAGKANTPGFENGKSNIISGTGAGTARFNASCDVTIDATGNIFVADTNNHVIRKISPAGDVTTVAGNGTAGHADGAAGSAMFRFPTRLVVASSGDLYVSDSGNHVIRKIASGSLTVSTFAGNGTQAAVNATEAAGYVDATGAEAKFSNPNGIALDFDGAVYVADTDNNVIRMISTSGEVTTLAGNGTAGFLNDAVKKAMFNRPQGVTVDMAKNVFVADTNNHMFRKITFNGEVQTLSGLAGQSGAADGDLKTAKYNYPKSIMVQQSTFYVADTENSVVRVLTTTTKPSVVSNVTITAKTATSVTLSWTAPSDGGSTIQTYSVGYGTLNGDLTYLPVPSGNTYTVSNLIPNSVYRFQVAASNYVGQGDWSSLITTQTPVGATSAPTGVVVSSADAPSSSSATISWTTPTALNGAPITGYVVSWVNTNTQLTTSANTTSTNTTYTITGLTAFTTYSVSVQATNSAGNSTASTPVSVRLQHKAFTYYPGGGFCNSTTYSPLGTVSRMHAKCTTANCALVDPTSLNSTLYSQQCFSNVPTPTNNTDNVQLAYYSNNGACSGVAYSAYFSYRQSGACVPNTITNSGGYVYVTCTSAHFCTDSDCKSCAAASSWSATKTCNSLNGGSASYSLFCAYRSASAAVVPSVFITLALILVALF